MAYLLTLAWMCAATLAAGCFYLATPHQRLSAALLTHGRRLRVAAWALCVIAEVAAWAALGSWAGVFAALTMFMLVSVALPFSDRLRPRARGEADVD
jgi:hypothetical protein